ncbi:hypothetical protein HN832_01415 [archaeon]|jgi:hypothetical protein|nr:hypothetical protein [archaeon]MBT4373958.1 hypothetical protein [archaeon]MBT4532351.1 hypothetical protein [archaeon]MBT7001937.1 hypothetical protein [archaeon]MBT7282050.1 hypothetical protein [archaeon]
MKAEYGKTICENIIEGTNYDYCGSNQECEYQGTNRPYVTPEFPDHIRGRKHICIKGDNKLRGQKF